MNGDDMINEGGPVYLGRNDVVDPPLSFEVVGPMDGFRWLLVKQDGRVIYQRTLTDEEQDAVVNDDLGKFSWMKHMHGDW